MTSAIKFTVFLGAAITGAAHNAEPDAHKTGAVVLKDFFPQPNTTDAQGPEPAIIENGYTTQANATNASYNTTGTLVTTCTDPKTKTNVTIGVPPGRDPKCDQYFSDRYLCSEFYITDNPSFRGALTVTRQPGQPVDLAQANYAISVLNQKSYEAILCSVVATQYTSYSPSPAVQISYANITDITNFTLPDVVIGNALPVSAGDMVNYTEMIVIYLLQNFPPYRTKAPTAPTPLPTTSSPTPPTLAPSTNVPTSTPSTNAPTSRTPTTASPTNPEQSTTIEWTAGIGGTVLLVFFICCVRSFCCTKQQRADRRDKRLNEIFNEKTANEKSKLFVIDTKAELVAEVAVLTADLKKYGRNPENEYKDQIALFVQNVGDPAVQDANKKLPWYTRLWWMIH